MEERLCRARFSGPPAMSQSCFLRLFPEPLLGKAPTELRGGCWLQNRNKVLFGNVQNLGVVAEFLHVSFMGNVQTTICSTGSPKEALFFLSRSLSCMKLTPHGTPEDEGKAADQSKSFLAAWSCLPFARGRHAGGGASDGGPLPLSS